MCLVSWIIFRKHKLVNYNFITFVEQDRALTKYGQPIKLGFCNIITYTYLVNIDSITGFIGDKVTTETNCRLLGNNLVDLKFQTLIDVWI